MPRHMQLFVDRFLCDRVVPGNRVTVLGIYSIKKTGQVKQWINVRIRPATRVRQVQWMSENRKLKVTTDKKVVYDTNGLGLHPVFERPGFRH